MRMKNETDRKGLQNMHPTSTTVANVRFAPLASKLLALPKCLLSPRYPSSSGADPILPFSSLSGCSPDSQPGACPCHLGGSQCHSCSPSKGVAAASQRHEGPCPRSRDG